MASSLMFSDEGVRTKRGETLRQRVSDQAGSAGYRRNTAMQIEHILHAKETSE